MRFKTLLLGSAAVIASAAAAQAADLSVAEPVDYVRVCDAFGEGYWYVPGTDTCIALAGKVEFGIYFGGGPSIDDGYEVGDGSIVPVEGHDNDWAFYTATDVNVQARSMTDWGPLVAYITMTGTHGYWDEADYSVDEAFISLGPLLMGYTSSLLDGGAGYTDDGLDLANSDVNQVTLSWAFNGFGFAFSIEDPSERYGSSADSTPALDAELTAEMGGFDFELDVFYGPNDLDDTIAVMGDVSTEVGMFEFSLAALWVDGYGIKTWDDTRSGDGWSVNVSSQQNWQSNFYTAETFVWSDLSNISADWGAEFTVAYSPVDTLWFYANALTENEGDDWDFLIYAEKTFGADY